MGPLGGAATEVWFSILCGGLFEQAQQHFFRKQ